MFAFLFLVQYRWQGDHRTYIALLCSACFSSFSHWYYYSITTFVWRKKKVKTRRGSRRKSFFSAVFKSGSISTRLQFLQTGTIFQRAQCALLSIGSWGGSSVSVSLSFMNRAHMFFWFTISLSLWTLCGRDSEYHRVSFSTASQHLIASTYSLKIKVCSFSFWQRWLYR